MSSIRMRTLRALGKQAVKQNLWNLRKRSDLFQTQRLLGHAISTDKAHMETSAEKARAHPVVRKVLGTAEKLGEGTGERRSSGPCRSGTAATTLHIWTMHLWNRELEQKYVSPLNLASDTYLNNQRTDR
ncbi:hypothetical protein RJZ90_006643 [Blastomyces dermatitidis]